MKKYLRNFSLIYFCMLIVITINMGFSQLMWEKNYGGADSDVGYSVQQNTDGGYIIVGSTYSFGNSSQVYLVKTDSLGDTLWSNAYGGNGIEVGYSVQQTLDGGYIVVGYSGSFGDSNQVYLIKTDSIGDTLWTGIYGNSGDDRGMSIQQTVDGEYIIVGHTNSYGNSTQVYLIKTDSLGDTLWTKTFGGTLHDRGYSVQQTQDGGYVICGEGNSNLDYDPVYLIKVDSLGDTMWTKTYGDAYDEGRSVQQTQDGGYIIAGIQAFLGIDIYLIKTDSIGDTLWSKYYRWQDASKGYSVHQTQDGGYIVAGWALKMVGTIEYQYSYIVKTDSLGDTLWTRIYGDGTNTIDGFRNARQTTDGGYIVVGSIHTPINGIQVYLIKTDADGNTGITDNGRAWHQLYTTDIKVVPNPFVNFAAVLGCEREYFILYDITGERVGYYSGSRIGFDLPAGVYFLVSEDQNSYPVRIVKIK
jgi:hypothetical protein